jgi:hypothetical protein
MNLTFQWNAFPPKIARRFGGNREAWTATAIAALAAIDRPVLFPMFVVTLF